MHENNIDSSNNVPQQVDDSESEKSEDEAPIKKPPTKRKPGPASSKRKIQSSESEASPVKKKVRKKISPNLIETNAFYLF